MDKSTRHLPARLAPLFHGVATIIQETGVERAASTGYVAWPPGRARASSEATARRRSRMM